MVYSTLDIFTAVVSTRGQVTHGKVCCRGSPHPQQTFLAATLTLVEYSTQEEGNSKNQQSDKLASCYNYKGNELGSIA